MFNKTIPRGGNGAGRGGAGWGGSKKCKPIPTLSRGAGLKSHPIPAPPPLRGGENPHGAKRGGAGQAGRGKIAIPTLVCLSAVLTLFFGRLWKIIFVGKSLFFYLGLG